MNFKIRVLLEGVISKASIEVKIFANNYTLAYFFFPEFHKVASFVVFVLSGQRYSNHASVYTTSFKPGS